MLNTLTIMALVLCWALLAVKRSCGRSQHPAHVQGINTPALA
jgi:hypothetical protein